MVHDIGWNTGQSGHQKKSAELILSCAGLPVQVREQGIIAIIARLHGGNVQTRPNGFFVLLSPADQKKALVLAAILRVADGLDYLQPEASPGFGAQSVKPTFFVHLPQRLILRPRKRGPSGKAICLLKYSKRRWWLHEVQTKDRSCRTHYCIY